MAWALNHAHLFTKGCPNLIVSTDHKPLLGLFNNKPLENISNPKLVRFKEHTLGFNFVVKYMKGKWHRAPDALSRSPTTESSVLAIASLFVNKCEFDTSEELVPDTAAPLAVAELSADSSVSLDDVRQASATDTEMILLTSTVRNGFANTHHLTDPLIRPYFNVRDELWIENGVLMFQNRLVIPKALRPNILSMLHSAHQGVEGMRARASNTVYWPGLSSCIKKLRNSCGVCNKIAPSQANQPLQLIPPPKFPFQHVSMDAFELYGQHYFAIVDKFSSWLIIFHVRRPPTHIHLISCLRSVFAVYGAPERLFTDGGMQFQAQEFGSFLKRWKVHHVTSSAFYPQGNSRAELAVKTAKRLLQENVAPDGSLNTEKVSRALLQYRNTPIQHLGLSPSQLLFHRNLRDSLPVNPRSLRPSKLWIEAAHRREAAFRQRNLAMTNRYNRTTRQLPVLTPGTHVLVQDTSGKKRWSLSGVIVEVEDRKYYIRMDGSGRIISRNRKFIKPAFLDEYEDTSLLLPSLPLSDRRNNSSSSRPNTPTPVIDSTEDSGTTPDIQRPLIDSTEDSATVSQGHQSSGTRVPRMLQNLRDYNRRGLREDDRLRRRTHT